MSAPYFAAPISLLAGAALVRILELLALLFGALLQLFLQLLLGFLEHLRIGRRTVIGLGEFAGERQRQRQRRAVGVDRLHDEVLALLHAGDAIPASPRSRTCSRWEADHVGALQRRIAVDDDAGAVHELHAERQRHAQDLLRLAFRLDDDGRDDRLAGLDAAVLAGEADLLGVGVLALQAELGPGRIDQLDLLFRRAGPRGGGAGAPGRAAAGLRRGRRSRLGRRLRGAPSGGLRAQPLGAAGAGAGAGPARRKRADAADNAVAANKAKTRPRGRTDAAKIRKFIAENPF